MATVRLRGQLEKLAGGSEHEVEGTTVVELLRELERAHEALDGWILDETGAVRRHINVFVDGDQARPDSEVSERARIEILPAISGG